MKRIYVIAGGTVNHIRPHFALAAPAYGSVGREITDRLHRMLWASDDMESDCSSFMEGLLNGEDPDPVNKYGMEVVPIFTRMALGQRTMAGTHRTQEVLEAAGLKYVETNQDLKQLVDYLKSQENTRCIVMAAAVCDWEPQIIQSDYYDAPTGGSPVKMKNLTGSPVEFGKDKPRLKSRIPDGDPAQVNLTLRPSDKIIGDIRNGDTGRKDIFLVSFKATAGLTPEETYAAGLKGLKGSSSNLVLANDVQTGTNVVVTPEEFPYFGESRADALDNLCEMILGRTQLTFTRTVVTEGEPANLRELHEKGAIPQNFLPVLEHLIKRGAYKVLPWKDSTSGHFGCVVEGEDFSRISSVRKANHNLALEEGVSKIMGKTPDGRIIALGGRPSVGEHTQQQIYDEINGKDHEFLKETAIHSIVHFHCPLKELPPRKPSDMGPAMDALMKPALDNLAASFRPALRPQRMYECGSDQCGINTATGMELLDSSGIWAVHLEGHGPNIAFPRDAPAERVIEIIERFWDLDQKSGGLLAETV